MCSQVPVQHVLCIMEVLEAGQDILEDGDAVQGREVGSHVTPKVVPEVPVHAVLHDQVGHIGQRVLGLI